MSTPEDMRVERAGLRLVRLGGRTIIEFLKHHAKRASARFVEDLEYFADINPEHLAVTGGDRYAPQMTVVPRVAPKTDDDGEAA